MNGDFWLSIVVERFQRNQTDILIDILIHAYSLTHERILRSFSTVYYPFFYLFFAGSGREQRPPSFSSLRDAQHLHPVAGIHSSDLCKNVGASQT